MKNYVLYDEKYLGPGFLIITKDEGKIIKFFKIFIINNYGFPHYGLRAFSIFGKDNPDTDYTTIDFTFKDSGFMEKNIYKVFHHLCIELNNNQVETIDEFNQGKNYFSLKETDDTVTLTIAKDVYGVKNATDFVDINIGDENTCIHYQAIAMLYNQFLKLNVKLAKKEDIKQLVLLRLK